MLPMDFSNPTYRLKLAPVRRQPLLVLHNPLVGSKRRDVLGVLAVVTSGLIVPDVVATFAPKFARRRLPWEGRSRRRRAYFGPGGALGA